MSRKNRTEKIRLGFAWSIGIAAGVAIVFCGLFFMQQYDEAYYAEGGSLPELLLLVLAVVTGYYVGASSFHGTFSTWVSTEGKITIQEWIVGLFIFTAGSVWIAPRAFHTKPNSTGWALLFAAWVILVFALFRWRALRRIRKTKVGSE